MTLFSTTRWSLVRAARGAGVEARDALDRLCRQYRRPVQIYLARYDIAGMSSEDLAQEFFAHALAVDLVGRADRSLGGFRAYLVAALRRFVSTNLEAQSAAKRGGGATSVTDQVLVAIAADDPTPEQEFEQAWAAALLEAALRRLREEAERSGRGALFERLSPFLVDAAGRDDYQRLAVELDLRPNTIAAAVARLRSRYQALVRDELAQTVASAAELDDEAARLRRAVGR